MRKAICHAAVAGVCALIASVPVQGAVVTQNFSYENRSFLGFDSSLGTLLKVEVDVRTLAGFSYTLPNEPVLVASKATEIFVQDFTFDFPAAPQTVVTLSHFGTRALDNSLEGTVIMGQLDFTTHLSGPYTPGMEKIDDISRFITTGYVNVDEKDAVAPGGSKASFEYRSPSNQVVLRNLPAGGLHTDYLTYTGTVRYFYAPMSGTPEPATWAMLVLGFGVLGAAMRRATGGLPVLRTPRADGA